MPADKPSVTGIYIQVLPVSVVTFSSSSFIIGRSAQASRSASAKQTAVNRMDSPMYFQTMEPCGAPRSRRVAISFARLPDSARFRLM